MTVNFSSSALLEIDVQNDFCPGGALAVACGDEVAEPLNRLARLFAGRGSPVAATQDWHPAGHVSFASSHTGKKTGEIAGGQFLWPDHCVQGSAGADFYKGLDLNPVNLIVRKGFRENLDSYSAFFENDRKTATGLGAFFKGLSINTVFIGGLATDYCVFYSATDACRSGFKTFVIKDAIRGVNIPEDSVEKALQELAKMGAVLVDSGEIS